MALVTLSRQGVWWALKSGESGLRPVERLNELSAAAIHPIVGQQSRNSSCHLTRLQDPMAVELIL